MRMFLPNAVLRRSLFTTTTLRRGPQVVKFSTIESEVDVNLKKQSKTKEKIIESQAGLTVREIAMILQKQHTHMTYTDATTIVEQVFETMKKVRERFCGIEE